MLYGPRLPKAIAAATGGRELPSTIIKTALKSGLIYCGDSRYGGLDRNQMSPDGVIN